MEKNKKNTKVASSTIKKKDDKNTPKAVFAFGPMNYILMGVGIVLLGLGYILLSGGGSDDPNVFNPAMFDNRRLVAAPIFIVLGLVVEICAIMFRPKDNNNQKTQEDNTEL